MRKRLLVFVSPGTFQKGGWRTGSCNDDEGAPGQWFIDGIRGWVGYYSIKYWQELPPDPNE